MEWIVIEFHGGARYAHVVMEDNGSGEIMVFDNIDEAQKYAEEECQDARAVGL